MIMTQSRRVLLLGLFAVLVALALADGEETKADSASKANTKIDAYRAWLLENGARMDNLEFTRVARHGITVSPPEDLKVRRLLDGFRHTRFYARCIALHVLTYVPFTIGLERSFPRLHPQGIGGHNGNHLGLPRRSTLCD